jgi:hypothetical protein
MKDSIPVITLMAKALLVISGGWLLAMTAANLKVPTFLFSSLIGLCSQIPIINAFPEQIINFNLRVCWLNIKRI